MLTTEMTDKLYAYRATRDQMFAAVYRKDGIMRAKPDYASLGLKDHTAWAAEYDRVLARIEELQREYDRVLDRIEEEQRDKGAKQMNFRTEFPDFDPATMPAIPEAWTDISWHNDACPSFDTGTCNVFIDYANEADREFLGQPRFCVIAYPDHDGESFASDNWDAIIAFVNDHQQEVA